VVWCVFLQLLYIQVVWYCCFCGVSINTYHLTTLIIAGCENITDSFLLRSFIPDMSTSRYLTCGTQDNSVQEPHCAANSCHMANDRNVVSKRSFCQKLNQHDGSLSSLHHACMAVVTSNEFRNSAALNCAQRCSTDRNYYHADAPEPLCPSAHRVMRRSLVSPVEVGDSRQQCRQSAVSCGRMNQTMTKSCTRKTGNNDKWTTVSYKLEHLDMSGCWKVSDLSVRCAVFCLHTVADTYKIIGYHPCHC